MVTADTSAVKHPKPYPRRDSPQQVEPFSPAGQGYTPLQSAAPGAPQGQCSPSAYQVLISIADPSEKPPLHPSFASLGGNLSGHSQPAYSVSLPSTEANPIEPTAEANPLNQRQVQLNLSTATESTQTGCHSPQPPSLDHPGTGNAGTFIHDQHLPSNMPYVSHSHAFLTQHDGQLVPPNRFYTPTVLTGSGNQHTIPQVEILPPIATTYPSRRKTLRAAQACDGCRQRKAKCDEGRPSCGFCKEAGLACVYREVPPPKQDRTLLQILDRLTRIEAKLPDKDDGSRPPASVPPLTPQAQSLQDLSGAAAAAHPARPVAPLRRASTSNMNERLPSTSFSSDIAADEQDKDSEGPGELSIPMEHTTAAHKLLRWPSIKAFISKITDNEDYVMEAEEDRGLLRVYGRGEGNDPVDGGGVGESSEAGSPDTDDVNPASSESLWGTGLTLGDNVGVCREDAHRVGGLNADGSLQLDLPRLEHLVNSYFQNIHILHPFLDKECIAGLVSAFAAEVNSTTFAVSSMQKPPVKAPKRKRSTTTLMGSNSTTSRTPLERSIRTVLVLLVLALGKICDHHTWVPGPAPDNKTSPRSMMSPPSKADSPRTPVKHSPTLSAYPTYSTLPSAFEGPGRPNLSRRTSIEGHPQYEKMFDSRNVESRNVDVVPGLAYYALATEILGPLMGGNDLPHVQAGLLAGLYCGQLGRVLESWKWINWACVSCQVLLRKNKLENEQNAARKELIICAFWTCLQLESDLLAELDLPPSGISRLEQTVPLPPCTGKGVTDPAGNDPESLMWMYYLAQITLRKLLNRVHSELYKENKDSKHAGWSTESAAELDWQLGRWKNVLPQQLRWEDDEPPPSDINAARLRAKYYGARYIIHRPFVHYALHPLVPHGTYPLTEDLQRDAKSWHTPSHPMLSEMYTTLLHPNVPANAVYQPTGGQNSGMATAPPEPVAGVVDKSVTDACKSCIGAAIQSTKAFHGIRGRPIVTNIFSTAHAQFGNLLVLQAAYRSELLRETVNADDLKYLMEKTIQFFKHLSPISPTLRIDANILESSMKTLKFE
ncbi:hypothetical protein GP486_000407 [Trichoglossum hirsutum]|uniref:Zn(2)-C6 fungal-type domain-containing protein n=1 Tax=Trichoglossum hirsutum TaxID=265104 RepID=A0A9P8RU26_9PEZI|nr:hypothetical protein GP486_000407 [Trichoglossum hirsutum]